jgi:hypothetical protein
MRQVAAPQHSPTTLPPGRACGGEVAANGRVEWARVAAEHGYYDQSHLVHDFGELTGITPTAYRPRAASEWNHVAVG